MDKNTLKMVGEWAQSRVASGEEPPWTFHKLKQLVDITNDLVEGMDVTAVFEENTAVELPENVVMIDHFRRSEPKPDILLPT